MNILLCYSLFIFIFIEKSKAYPTKKGVYQIDEFIKQLMISQKFDELADVIADKAARRIKSMNSPNQKVSRQRDNKNEKHNLSSEKKQDEGYKNDNNEEKTSKFDEKINNYRGLENEKDSRSRETNYGRDNNRESQQKPLEKTGRSRSRTKSKFQDRETEQKETFSKVDMDTFLKTHITSKELELNFKHLKDELKKHRFNIKNNNQNVRNYDAEEKHNNTIEKIGKKQEESNKKEITELENRNNEKAVSQDSKELINQSDLSSNENIAHELSTFHGSKNKNEDIVKLSNENKSGYNLHDYNKPINEKGNQKPVPRNEKILNDSGDLSITIEENDSTKALIGDVVDNISKEFSKPKPEDPSKEIVEVGISHAISNEPDERYDKNIHNAVGGRKKITRVENGKKYTFQSSSEYVEYHEALAKENKSFFL